MSEISYNIQEVFDMAQEIERRGKRFYEQAANRSKNSSIRDFFLELADMEDKHEKLFKDMADKISAKNGSLEVYDPDNEMTCYLKQIACSQGWEGKMAKDVEFSGNESTEQILNSAIEAEKASVTFYVGLKQGIKTQSGRDQVDEIIREEMSHVARLNQYLLDL